MGHGYAGFCEVCDEEALWYLIRRGDVVISWACAEHVSEIMLRRQRDWEITEIVTKYFPKVLEWADIGKSLAEILRGEQ